MSKRSISDDEIALIKAMKGRLMKNKDIQFFFNRPDRPVNSGRISNIWSGTYGDAAKILAADDPTLDAFIAAHKPTPLGATVVVASGASAGDFNPISEATLQSLFAKSDGHWRLSAGESDEHECKAAFGLKYAGKWLRAVAALANNRGGYVLFGVHDKDNVKKDGIDLSHAVIGLTSTEFEDADTVKLTELLKGTFDPTPRIRKATVSIDGKSVGVLFVDAHPSRPVIATRQGDDIREGDIFYRYPAQSSRIKYSDLRALLDARDAQARQQLMPMVEKLLALGPQKALIADLEAGSLGDGRNIIQLQPELVERLKFVKEGEFSEKAGEPTLKLLGEVEGIVSPHAPFKKGFATKADLISDFLKQEAPSEPKEYLRLVVEGTQGEWLPIHYFAGKAGMDRASLAKFIGSTAAPAARRKVFAERASGKTTAYKKAGGAGAANLKLIEAGTLPVVKTEKDVSAVAAAIQGLTKPPAIPLVDLLGLLSQSIEIVRDIPRQVAMSVVRRAICRLDELYFAKADD